MRILLTVRHQLGEGGPYDYQFDQDEVLVGRDQAMDVCLPHQAVSLVHLRLVRWEGQLCAIDVGSTNGTRLDGVPLQPESKAVVREGSRLQLGPFELLIGGTSAATARSPSVPTDTAGIARQIVCDVLNASSGVCAPCIEVLNGPQQGEQLRLPMLGEPALVGRGEECALRLDDADASRKHFELRRNGPAVELRDLGSKNGVAVNGQRVSGALILKHGYKLRVGNTQLVFLDPAEEYLAQLEQQRADDVKEEQVPAGVAVAAQRHLGPNAISPGGATSGRGGKLLAVSVVVLMAGAAAGLLYLLLGSASC